MNFRVGQKVVCVNDNNGPGVGSICRGHRVVSMTCKLENGVIYTVRSLGTCWQDGSPGIRLHEIARPIASITGEELCFFAHRFRPVIEKSTDTGMAVLREILDRETVKDATPIRKPVRVRD